MSNYRAYTKHPKTGKYEWADWVDDYFGSNMYGVRFGSDLTAYCAVTYNIKTEEAPKSKPDPLFSTTKPEDSVNNPSHYNDHPSGIECIDITRHMSFNIGNAVKYLWRHGKKDADKTIEDLEKAVFYIQDEINKLNK